MGNNLNLSGKPDSFFSKISRNKGISAFAFVIVFGAIAASMIFSSSAAPKPGGPHGSGGSGNVGGNGTAVISITPASQKVKAGDTLNVQIWEDSLDKPVNAVQANLSYDNTDFQYINIDRTNSPFEIGAQATESNGVVYIGSGHVGALTGKQLVATVSFVARATGGKTAINFTGGTLLTSSATNADILGTANGGNYSFAR